MSSQGGEGWPLGLPPVTLRMRLVEAFSAAGAGDAGTSFVLNATPSFSSLSSSDLDTESTGSFFPEKTITLGSLIGIAGASTAHPSFRRSLGSVNDIASTTAGPRNLITRFAWRRREPAGPTNTIKSTSWSSLIRCGSCRGTYDYPDDDSSIGAPPSLGHFLDTDMDLEMTSSNQAKVYINVMFEEDEHTRNENNAINPLFDSGRATSPSVVNLLNSNSQHSLSPLVNNVFCSSNLRAEAANDLQERMSVRSYIHQKQSHEDQMQNVELLRLQETARSIQSFQKTTAMLKSKSQRQQQSQSDRAGICMLSCVSHIWGFSKGTSNLINGDNEEDDIHSQCSSDKESPCNAKLEASTPMNQGISCYTNFSFDDSDCSIYFDDEDDPSTISNSKDPNTATDKNDAQEFEFCCPVAQASGTQV